VLFQTEKYCLLSEANYYTLTTSIFSIEYTKNLLKSTTIVMDKKEDLRTKIIALENLYAIDKSDHMKEITKENIQRILHEDPVKIIHLGDMNNKLLQQNRKLEQLNTHNGPQSTEEMVKKAKEKLEQEIILLKEIIDLYKETTRE